jgi:hypothetical protein
MQSIVKSLACLLLCVLAHATHAQFITNTGITISNSAIVYTNGEWQNAGKITNNGNIITTEAWINTGVLDSASTGGFVLRYAVDKSFVPGGTKLGFIIKEGAGKAITSGHLQLKDSLTISGGLIVFASAEDELKVASSGIVTTTPGSFIDGGNLVRQGTGTLHFPVGRNGVALPITFQNVKGNSPSITVSVEDAPANYTAGAGVNQLIDFPYVWRVTKNTASDTAAYVELEFPESITSATDIVVLRKIKGESKYEGMGARALTNNNGSTRLKSYSRGLQGTYSVGRGFPGNLKTDALALASLYQSAQGTSWPKRANWMTDDVETWEGVTVTGGQVTSVVLPNNKLKGPLPESFADMAALQTINISGNEVTTLPDMTGSTGITSFNVSGNKLGFGSLLPNMGIPGFIYGGQAALTENDSLVIPVGTDQLLSISTDGNGNQYSWKFKGAPIASATSNELKIESIGRSKMGVYQGIVTNPGVPGLTLTTGEHIVLASATLAGRLLEAPDDPVKKGKVKLLAIRATGGYDTTLVKEINADGTYVLDKVILDDYALLGISDSTVHKDDLPTYYNNKLFWEQADTLRVNNNMPALDITMINKPTEKPEGDGFLSGVFKDAENSHGRIQTERISGAAVVVSRKKNVGRPQDFILTVIAYLYTDENGEFDVSGLSIGDYALNIQYPGYLMDPNSFINFTIGTGLSRRVSVDALVTNNEIVVRRVVITGLEEGEQRFSVYPNPASDIVNIDVKTAINGLTYSVTNLHGSNVLKGSLEYGATAIDITSLAPGAYVVQMQQFGDVISTFKIIISN